MYPAKPSEQAEEVAVTAERISERVRGVALVVAAYALDGQVEAVGDAAGNPRAWLIVHFRSIRLPGQRTIPPMV